MFSSKPFFILRFEVKKQTFFLKEKANFSTFFRKVRVLPCYGKKYNKIRLFFKRFSAIFKFFVTTGYFMKIRICFHLNVIK